MVPDNESNASMAQLIGIIVIANSLLVAGWWVAAGRQRLVPMLLVCALAVVAGIVILLRDRATAAAVKELTAIKASAEQAAADAGQVAAKAAELNREWEAARERADRIDKAATEAGRLSEEIGTKNADAAKRLQELDQTLKRASAELAEIEARSNAVKSYADVARLNLIGKSSLEGETGNATPISSALAGTYDMNGPRAVFKEDIASERKFRDVITRFPRFPFTYWVLADILKRRGDPSWRGYAFIAENVLKKTTEVPGHDPGHDLALEAVERLLGEKNTP
jgi:hypothetical protein